MVLGRIGERIDRVEANLKGGKHNANEVESGSEENYESKIDVGRHRPRRVRHERVGEITLGVEMKKMGV